MLVTACIHQGNDLGYGKNSKDWTIRSQASLFINCIQFMKEVEGSETKWLSVTLKIYNLNFKVA
jgi:hypothetical protein